MILHSKLTLKKLRIAASSHIDLMLHRGNCDSGGSRTRGVTILLYGLGGEGGASSSSSSSSLSRRKDLTLDLCFRPPDTSASAAAYSRAAERAVHARGGLSLLTAALLPLSLIWKWIGDEDGSTDIMPSKNQGL